MEATASCLKMSSFNSETTVCIVLSISSRIANFSCDLNSLKVICLTFRGIYFWEALLTPLQPSHDCSHCFHQSAQKPTKLSFSFHITCVAKLPIFHYLSLKFLLVDHTHFYSVCQFYLTNVFIELVVFITIKNQRPCELLTAGRQCSSLHPCSENGSVWIDCESKVRTTCKFSPWERLEMFGLLLSGICSPFSAREIPLIISAREQACKLPQSGGFFL